jgi:hypothetical protein
MAGEWRNCVRTTEIGGKRWRGIRLALRQPNGGGFPLGGVKHSRNMAEVCV